MAKKAFLPTSSLDSAVDNVSKAGKKKDENIEPEIAAKPKKKQPTPVISPLPVPVVEVVETKKIKIERYANRPKLTNIHIDYDMEDKLNEVKKIMNRGKKTAEKTTLDDIIYNAIVEWLNNHYEEVVG